ncbi:MAG: SDR family oxidoreductase [Acidobacteria bacterium]|nr:SDR family oxidoreductase [Acidobacteriota bacterium]
MVTTAELDHRGTRLAGKVAIVVGGGSTGDIPGTGSAIAMLFAAQGAKVAVVGRTQANTQKTVDLIAAAGDTALTLLGDTTSDEDCGRIVAAVAAEWGQIDILVNNVGTTASPTIADFDEAIWDQSFDTNVKAPILMTKHALPHLKARDTASIVNIGSVTGMQTSGGIGYATSKGAVMVLTRDMAAALGPDGIRVNCVVPGHLNTPIGTLPGEGLRQLRRDLSMLRIEGTGWDAAYAALFFASDESRYITAVSMPVDGGVTGLLAFATVMRLKAAEAQA